MVISIIVLMSENLFGKRVSKKLEYKLWFLALVEILIETSFIDYMKGN